MKNDPEFKRKRKEYHARRYRAQRDRLLAQNLAWQKANPEKVRAIDKAAYARNHAKSLVALAQKRARRQGIPFDITPEDISIPEVCPYFQVPMKRAEKGGNLSFSPSIDRIEPKKGYVKGNVQVISRLANCMKWTSTEEQLISFAEGVLRIHKKVA